MSRKCPMILPKGKITDSSVNFYFETLISLELTFGGVTLDHWSFKGVILDFGQNRPILENLQILNRWSKIDSDFFNRTLDAPKRAWTIVSWPQRSYRFLSADKQRGLLNLRIRSTGATVDRFWCVDYHFDGNGLNKSLQVFVLWYLSLEDRKALSCGRQFFRKSLFRKSHCSSSYGHASD